MLDDLPYTQEYLDAGKPRVRDHLTAIAAEDCSPNQRCSGQYSRHTVRRALAGFVGRLWPALAASALNRGYRSRARL